MTTPPPLPDPAYRTNFGSGLRAYSTEQMHEYAAQEVAAERERIASLWAGCYTEAEGHGFVDIGASIRAGALVDEA